jgi:hypothetical protein
VATSVDDLRKHVLEDAIELAETIGLVRPLVTQNIVEPAKKFLRRVLAGHVVLVLFRLYDQANPTGSRGVTASINGLLDALEKAPGSLTPDDIKKFRAKSEELRNSYESAGGTFGELTMFRHTELAHSLHPHNPTSPQIQWHPLEQFSQSTFELVLSLESVLRYNELIERGRAFWKCAP